MGGSEAAQHDFIKVKFSRQCLMFTGLEFAESSVIEADDDGEQKRHLKELK